MMYIFCGGYLLSHVLEFFNLYRFRKFAYKLKDTSGERNTAFVKTAVMFMALFLLTVTLCLSLCGATASASNIDFVVVAPFLIVSVCLLPLCIIWYLSINKRLMKIACNTTLTEYQKGWQWGYFCLAVICGIFKAFLTAFIVLFLTNISL